MKNKISQKRENDYQIGQFLKRKRLEKGMKLEDVASGICSVSYLSRIENDLALTSTDNLKALFERFDLDYENVKEIRQNNIYEELLVKELSNHKKEINEIISQAINNKAYASIELDLLVLYNSIFNEMYSEAKNILIKQNAIKEMYSNQELVFYLYLVTRYLHETNQTKKAYNQIRVLCSLENNSEIMKSVIYDIAINIMNSLGKEAEMVNFYYLLGRSECAYLFGKKLNYHQMKLLTVSSEFNYESAIKQMQKIYTMIEEDDQKTKQEYYYYLALIYYQNHLYDKAIKVLNENTKNAKSMALYAFLVNSCGSPNDRNQFLVDHRNYKYTKYEKLYQNFSEYYAIKFNKESNYHLYNYLKMNILNNNTLFFDALVFKNASYELLDIGVLSSKYKETLHYIKEYIL